MTVTHHRRRPTTRRGFTILELLIVIGILLAIGGLVLYNVLGASEKADVKLAKAQIQSFESALEEFKFDMKRWPSEDEGLSVLWSKEKLDAEEDQDKWTGPYLKEPKPKDTWGNEWIYRQPSSVEGRPYDIISPGPDKQEGTEDDITSNDGRVGTDGSDEFGDFSSGTGGG
ncbi:MAG: type II secretion system major pseudopilin GspG [Phycisphaerales bacterium]|nr:type II secretion system major pseudopilin GspG [Phycisphaerales bacterium]